MTIKSKIKLNDDFLIPRLGFGTWLLDKEFVDTSIKSALNCGYIHIDTAQIYNNEYDIGKTLEKYDRRDLFITSKVWPSNYRHYIKKSIGESLRRLKIDYFDLLLLHWPYSPEPSLNNAAYKELMIARNKGLVKSIGVSNFSISDLKSIYKEFGEWPAVNQFLFSPKVQSNELVKFCTDNGIVVEGYSLLRILFDSKNDPEYVKKFKRHAGYFSDKEKNYLDTLCKKYDKTLAQILIRWAIERNIVIFPKSKTPSRIKENANVFDFVLTNDEIKGINDMNEGSNTKQTSEHIKNFDLDFEKGLIFDKHF